jgi:exopolysaccharide production protein ExoQ
VADAALRRAETDRWLEPSRLQRQARTALAENATIIWSGTILILMLLYVMIGSNPLVHDVTLDPKTGGTEISPVNRYIWLGLLGLSIPVLFYRRMELPALAKKIAPLLLMLGWFFLTTRWALDPATSTRRFILYMVNVVICISVLAGLRDGRRLHTCLAVAGAIMVAIDFGCWILFPAASQTEIGLAAIHSHKNTLGAVMLFVGYVCGAYAWSQTKWRGIIFWWGVTVGALVLLAASLSKTSMAIFVALAIGSPLLVLLVRRKTPTLTAILACLVFVLVAVAFGWMALNYIRGDDPFAPFLKITFTKRTDVWAFVYSNIVKRPILGFGFGSFWDIDPRVQPSLKSDGWFAQADAFTNESHNGYLDLTVSSGLIGLTLAVYVLFRWIGRGLTLTRRAALAAAGPDRKKVLAYGVILGVVPLLIFYHNLLESSLFTANSVYGSFVLILGLEIDRQFTKPSA